MSMQMPNPNPERDPQEGEPSSGDARDLFAEATRRMSQRRSAPRTEPGPAEAIGALTGSAHPVNRYLANRNARAKTQSGYEYQLRRAAALLVEAGFEEGAGVVPVHGFPWHRISVADADALNRLLAKKYTNGGSRAIVLCAVRSMLRECARADLIDRRTCDQVLDALPVRGVQTPPAGRELCDEELLALQRAAAANPNPVLAARNSAVIAVFMSTGCRISEASDLDVSDYRAEDDSLLLRTTKSGRSVRVWLNTWAADRLNHWLGVRGVEPGPMFTSLRGARMSTWGLRDLVAKAVKDAGLTRRTTSHDFRRTFITRMLRAGVDPFTVRRLVNHKKVQTTMVYDRRTEDENRQAVQRLQLPEPPSAAPGPDGPADWKESA
jgi:integrase